MKVLVTGASGQLGYDVYRVLQDNGFDVYSPRHSEMDIVDLSSVRKVLSIERPEVVVHCAAWTNVDLAEDEEEKCRATNVDGTINIVECCKIMNIPIVYISTDYVFDGTGEEPWKIGDTPNPQNVYGKSKYDGERAVREYSKHFIIRISWVFGINGKNFVKTMLDLSKKRNEISVVGDQIGSPTYTKDVAILIKDMIVTDKYGTYHACNSGYCSWADFARKIFEIRDKNVIVTVIPSDEWPSKVKRPLNSRMDTSSLIDAGFNLLPPWEDALKRFLEEYPE